MELEYSEKLPAFSDLIRGISNVLQTSYYETFVEIRATNKLDSWNITTYDIACVVLMTSVLSTLRFFLTKRVFMPIADNYDIPEASRQKVPECAWKFTYYLCIGCYEWYVVVMSGKYKFFQKPESMWSGWSLEELIEGDIYSIYIIECAFYLQYTYSTLFLDDWRKDYVALILHHILTVVLIITSQAARCHHIGALIFFLHNASDIFMEFAKLCSYFKIQGHKVKDWIEIVKTVAFACFTATWFTTRLYWFPLKALYSLAVHPQKLKLNIPYYFMMNLLLWKLLFLHIYWSMLILKIIYRTLTGQNLEDIREVADTKICSEQLSSDDNYSNAILRRKYSTNFRQN